MKYTARGDTDSITTQPQLYNYLLDIFMVVIEMLNPMQITLTLTGIFLGNEFRRGKS